MFSTLVPVPLVKNNSGDLTSKEYYRNRSSSIYVWFLDTSKAFDKVNHWLLLKKLIVREVPHYVIRLLVFWYTQQPFCVKWGDATSGYFHVKMV